MRSHLVLAACAFCLLHGSAAASAQEREKAVLPSAPIAPPANGFKMLDPGVLAPDFSIKDAEGATFRLVDARGKRALLLVFWSMFCEPCRLEMPVVQKMHLQHKDTGLEVIAISLDGSALTNSIRGFAKQEGYTFKVLIDELDAREAFKAADLYGVAGVPTVYLVDRAGRIAFARAGRVKEVELEKAIQVLVK